MPAGRARRVGLYRLDRRHDRLGTPRGRAHGQAEGLIRVGPRREQAPTERTMSDSAHEVIIIGGGIAGLFCALKLSPRPATVVTAAPIGEGASSAWAQGGIAAAVAGGDTPEAHARDTIAVGAGLVDETLARAMTREAPERVRDLLAYGVPFDKDLEGRLAVGREAAHSARRIVHVRGDLAGR